MPSVVLAPLRRHRAEPGVNMPSVLKPETVHFVLSTTCKDFVAVVVVRHI